MSTILIQIVLAGLLFAMGLAGGIKYHAGQDAIAAAEAKEQLEQDQREQRAANNKAVAAHQNTIAKLSTQLGAARVQISKLSGRTCLDAGTVRMLNDIGGEPVRAPAPNAAGTPPSPAINQADSSDIDIADAIATCRASYAQVSTQLNLVLDIEDRRSPPAKDAK